MSDYNNWLDSEWPKAEAYPVDQMNIAGFSLGKFSEGTGIRNAIFFQGCPLFCPGCRNIKPKRMTLNRLWSIDELCELLDAWRVVSFPTERYSAEDSYKKFLYLEAVKHTAWEVVNNPITEDTIRGLPAKEYFNLGYDLFSRLLGFVKTESSLKAPASWPQMQSTGITLSGGDPLVQPEVMRSFILAVRDRFPEWDVWMYTGLYNFEEVTTKPELRRVAELTDAMKVGAFTWRREDVSHFYYGSSDQVALDTKPSLETGEPVVLKLPEIIEKAIAISGRMASEKLVPRLKPETIEKLYSIPRFEGEFTVIEEFEDLFGSLSSDSPTELFDFEPKAPKAKAFAFLKPRTLNVFRRYNMPLHGTELPCVEVLLKGSYFPPAAEVKPKVTDMRPEQIWEADKLLDDLVTSCDWNFEIGMGEEAAKRRWMNLALQARLLFVQIDYFMVRSPVRWLKLPEYKKAAQRYRNQLRALFNREGRGISLKAESLFIRGGDPTLQAKGVEALASEAKDRGLEVWIESPYSWRNLQSSEEGRLIKSCADFLVCGQQADGGPPSAHRFKSSPKQSVVHAKSGEAWTPRFSWSKQVLDFENRFTSAKAIADFRLSRRAIEHFTTNASTAMSYEELESLVGSFIRRW